jgi:endonuclease/exonuclease/phosphatase family metal-dependent hydrolase
LRVVAANLTSGNNQSYDPGHGARILKGLKPDVVLIQEFNYGNNTPTEFQSFVTANFGSEFSYYREGGQIPNGVISRYPIIASGEWDDPEVDNRDFAWATIDLPGPRDLWAVSIHLLTSSANNRYKEAKVLVDRLNALVPKDDFIVLGGDLNTNNRQESCLGKLAERVVTTAPYPVDQDDNDNTNRGRNKPYDWVFASPDLHAMAVPVQVGNQLFPNGLVFDSRVFKPLEEVPPVLQGDSGGTQMQHMAVVRDFLVQ